MNQLPSCKVPQHVATCQAVQGVWMLENMENFLATGLICNELLQKLTAVA